MPTPKGKTPSLLTQSTGKPSVYTCKRKTACSRCQEDILNGEKCFKIPKYSSGFTSQKPYCLKCFKLIIVPTQKDLLILEKTLSGLDGT